MTRDDLTPFARGYIQGLLATSLDDDQEPLDANYDIEDIHPDSLEKIADDCAKFVAANESHYADAENLSCSDGIWKPAESAGLDFWLTRNGHGSGFWDPDRKRHYGEANAEAMNAYSEAAGGCDAYIGDDGKVHI